MHKNFKIFIFKIHKGTGIFEKPKSSLKVLNKKIIWKELKR